MGSTPLEGLESVAAKPSIILSQVYRGDEEKGYTPQTSKAEGRKYPLWLSSLIRHLPNIPPRQKKHPGFDFATRIKNIEKSAHGYPRLAAFVDSDPSFMIYRRFGYLRTRLLLYHQGVLRSKEYELDCLDKKDSSDPARERFLYNREDDGKQEPPRRKELFEELDEEFKVYDELLSRSAAMYQLTSPVDRNRKSVARFIWNDGKLHSPDRDYLQYVDDHITLGGDMERSVVHILFERLFTWASQPLSKLLFQTNIQAAKSKSAHLNVNLYSKARFDKVVATFFTALTTSMVMGPVFLLDRYQHSSDHKRSCIILGCTFAFALSCSVFTTAKRHEIFAATAAYCAVLVVFISQGPGSGS